MKREQYLAKRQELINAMQGFIDAGEIENFNNQKKEIEALDQQWDCIAQAQADFEAINKDSKVTNLQAKNVMVAGKVIDSTNAVLSDNVFDSMEYRKAFMNYVAHGAAIPAEFVNVDANTKTSDIGAVIPNTVLEKIIEKLESVGMILPLITRTAIKGGVTVPTSSLKPVATWVAEGATSDKQKKTTGSITFAYYKLRCAVSVSLEVDTVALAIFETALINNVTEAMVKSIEQSIISGTGVGQPKGIIKETVIAAQALTGTPTYANLVKMEAALPLAYEGGAVHVMTKATFMQYMGELGADLHPIARVNYGISGKPERTLLGRNVVLCDYLPTYATGLTVGDIFHFMFDFKDYALNTNYNMTIKKYEDNATDDQVTKAIMLVDGKALDINSLVVLKR